MITRNKKNFFIIAVLFVLCIGLSLSVFIIFRNQNRNDKSQCVSNLQLFWVEVITITAIVVLFVFFLYSCTSSEVKKEKQKENMKRIPYAPVPVDSVLTVSECERLIAYAIKNSMKRSMTLGDVISDVRTSEQTWADVNNETVGDIVTKIMTRTGQMTGIFREDLFEQLQIARYEPSQEYKPHFDACVEQCDRDGRERIPRRATLLVYLTDNFEEGYTHFSAIDMHVRPVRGNGVLFYNSDADTGVEIPDSIHAGEPVISGTKWIANCWVRYDPKSRYL
jgi:prolyl 4-hydroxylase